MSIDKNTRKILKELREAKVLDFQKFRDSEDVDYLKNIYNQIADIEQDYKNKVSQNEKTATILYLMSTLLDEMKAYISKVEKD